MQNKQILVKLKKLDYRSDSFLLALLNKKLTAEISKVKPSSNVLEYERKKTYEKRTDYGRYERIETREYSEKRLPPDKARMSQKAKNGWAIYLALPAQCC